LRGLDQREPARTALAAQEQGVARRTERSVLQVIALTSAKRAGFVPALHSLARSRGARSASEGFGFLQARAGFQLQVQRRGM
jgi:hypothetical protein